MDIQEMGLVPRQNDETNSAKKAADQQQQPFCFDARKKKHPELQPYVPFDRFTSLSSASTNKGSPFGGSSTLSSKTANAHHPKANLVSSNKHAPINRQNIDKHSSSSTKQSKKYVSMSRLDQLAQPKKIVLKSNQPTTNQAVPPSSLTSSNATSTTTSSLASNRNYNYSATSNRSSTGGRHSGVSNRAKNDVSSSSKSSQQQRNSLRQSDVKSKQQEQQRQRRLSQPKSAASKQSGRFSLKESTPIKLDDETNLKSCSSSRSISPVKIMNETMDRPPKTPAKSVKDESPDASGIIEQVSELSMNDRFYQSAASELMLDSEINSTNGIKFDRNPDSLCRELEEDLKAKGIVTDDQGERTPQANIDNFTDCDDSIRRGSTKITDDRELLDTPKFTKEEHEKLKARFAEEDEMKRKREEQEEEKRLKLEEEIREKARREEEERIQRNNLIDKILSRVSQSPSGRAN